MKQNPMFLIGVQRKILFENEAKRNTCLHLLFEEKVELCSIKR
jgi:hypothetical protein